MATTTTRAALTSEGARRAIQAAEACAREAGANLVIAIVDESGVLKAFSRMDGAPFLSVEFAQDKAYTAAAFGIATHAWFDFIKDDPPLLHGSRQIDRLIVFGGGYPIVIDGTVAGGIGVGGGRGNIDVEAAEAALAAIAAG
jgi:uncharacterized protein GlcG (DUF336 family)